MGFSAALAHLLNFAAPALVLALGLAAAGRLVSPGAGHLTGWWVQVAINFAVGCGVLLAGLVWFERDGKLATYAALVLACAACQWVLAGGWRR
ncbi:hypothetical protein [Comamonas endophytica]|uniref:Uncharacterized protein n=1 Tax=Comamonas endophytica TaxID=2949090 RepID=A0ABY6GC38_9BURK|nr:MULTISPECIES: hypothetical protein [unclassified Acidovorax]MCD2513026.1 hypothetical protein [Acidovorax sp. D4N7]UYG52634.1 hypothetical protein M9799_05165 [Acidovorax sp. 5MLIR]